MLQYKKEVEMMLEVARSYIQSHSAVAAADAGDNAAEETTSSPSVTQDSG